MLHRAFLIFFCSATLCLASAIPLDRTQDLSAYLSGRLTLTSATPVTVTDVTAAGTLYYTPYNGNRIALYDGSTWNLHSFTERSLALSISSGSNYDVFLYDNSGTLTLELSAAWTNDTTRNEALALQDGIYVKSGATTRRYLGTIRGSGANTTEDSVEKRFVWNFYHRAGKLFSKTDATTSWSYSTAAYRASNNSTSNRVQLVTGMADNLLELKFVQLINTSSAAYFGICEDCTNAHNAAVYGYVNTATRLSVSPLIKFPSLGFHYYQMVEFGAGGTLFYGNGNMILMGVWPC